MDSFTTDLIERTKEFAKEVDSLTFSLTQYVYNPLIYAWQMHKEYLRRYVHQHIPIYFLGMNPGPFGMAQTGVPFGEVHMVKEWMGIEEPIGEPAMMHPKRPVLGLNVKRSEVSGKRVWSLMRERYQSADNFFHTHAVMNYCPLLFIDEGVTGRNLIPEKLIKEEREKLERVCDAYLDDTLSLIKPKALVGIGRYAQKKVEEGAKRVGFSGIVTSILHPSPGNPQANAGWAEIVTKQLQEAQLW